MKTIKKVTALLLSMVLLFSFFVTQVLAYDHLFASLLPSDDRLTIHFEKYGVEIDSYAEAYCTAYYAEDCDLGVKTYVTNDYYGTSDAVYSTTTAYVKLTVEFESGVSGTLESAVQCSPNDEDAVVRIFGMRVVDVELDDTLSDFLSTHLVMGGSYVAEPLTSPYCNPKPGVNHIYIGN